MSAYLIPELKNLKPYVPGEQPGGREYLKLNTNESPFPPSRKVIGAIRGKGVSGLRLYPDPEAGALREALARKYGLKKGNVLCVNGSDEALALAFRAFCGAGTGAVFSDITYGFYPVYCNLFGIQKTLLPVGENLEIRPSDYIGIKKASVFIANPNAKTGLLLSVSQIEEIVASDLGRVVVIDEAYIDFGGESAAPLTLKYPNLLVVGTFSKSRSLAGGRLGFALGDGGLIESLNTLRYAFHPYSVNRMTMAAGIASLADEGYFRKRVNEIIESRETAKAALLRRGFQVTDSKGNFLLARDPEISGEKLYRKLKDEGVLVRHFPEERIADYIRITVGSLKQMKTLIKCIDNIKKGGK